MSRHTACNNSDEKKLKRIITQQKDRSHNNFSRIRVSNRIYIYDALILLGADFRIASRLCIGYIRFYEGSMVYAIRGRFYFSFFVVVVAGLSVFHFIY